MMPRSCDPVTAWWQRNVILDIIPMNSTNSEPKINLTDLIFNVPKFKEIGIQALKLKNICRQTSHQYASKPFQGEHRTTVQSKVHFLAVANIVTHAIVDIAFENAAGQTEFKKDDQSAFNGHIESNTVNRNETVPEDIQNFYRKIDAVDDEEDAINTSPQEIGCSNSTGFWPSKLKKLFLLLLFLPLPEATLHDTEIGPQQSINGHSTVVNTNRNPENSITKKISDPISKKDEQISNMQKVTCGHYQLSDGATSHDDLENKKAKAKVSDAIENSNLESKNIEATYEEASDPPEVQVYQIFMDGTTSVYISCRIKSKIKLENAAGQTFMIDRFYSNI